MGQEFTYIKKAQPDALRLELENAGFPILSILVSGNVVKIVTVNSLTQSEIQKFYKVVSAHTPEAYAAKERVVSAIQFGNSVILEFATENILLNLNTYQVGLMLQKFAHIKAMLESGSLHTALGAIMLIKPDSLMPQERIDRYARKIKKYLGVI